jgi:hypothetical protein
MVGRISKEAGRVQGIWQEGSPREAVYAKSKNITEGLLKILS